MAELHELVHDLAFGLLTLALAVLAHGLAQPPDAARAALPALQTLLEPHPQALDEVERVLHAVARP